MTSQFFILGLTGSIGMGKSTTSGFFKELGVPVWDADAVVHKLYEGDSAVVQGIAALAPKSVRNQKVNRGYLKHAIKENPKLLKEIEALVHPHVAANRTEFLAVARMGETLVIIDHPLLYETGEDSRCDAVLVVSASPAEQRRRVMSREGMTEETFQMLLEKQMPDAVKRSKADYILETTTPKAARQFVFELVEKLTSREVRNA